MTGIQWTDKTWNPVVGCTPVSPGCLNCYAATMALRQEGKGTKGYEPRWLEPDGSPSKCISTMFNKDAKFLRIVEKRAGRAVFTGDVRLVPERLTEPLKWRKPAMVFVNSMSDLFHESVPFEYVDQVMAVIAMSSRHKFQALTKRADRMADYFVTRGAETRRNVHAILERVVMGDVEWTIPTLPDTAEECPWPLPNLWLGTSVENQKAADERIPHLLKCPAAVRFLSVEPLLEEIKTLPLWLLPLAEGPAGKPPTIVRPALDWVIVGGESGNKARPCNVEWIRSVVRQCKDSEVPVFVKQLGAHIVCDNTKIADWEDQTNGAAYTRYDPDAQRFQGDIERVYVRDAKGGNMAEWPEDLRVREWPKAVGEAQSTEHK